MHTIVDMGASLSRLPLRAGMQPSHFLRTQRLSVVHTFACDPRRLNALTTSRLHVRLSRCQRLRKRRNRVTLHLHRLYLRSLW